MFAHTNLITYESLYSSSYLLNEYLLYDKLWGPSQRVVTLFDFGRTLINIFGCKGSVKLLSSYIDLLWEMTNVAIRSDSIYDIFSFFMRNIRCTSKPQNMN